MSDRLKQLEKMYEADAGDPFITYAMAMEFIKAGNDAQAERWLNETLKLDKTYAYAYFQKAKVLQQNDRTDEAKVTLAKGIEQAQETGDEKAIAELRDLMSMM